MLYNWFQHIEFAWPSFLGLFILLPLMTYWYVVYGSRQQGTMIISTSAPVVRAGASWRTALRHIPFVLRLLAISCLIVALARPQTRNDEELKSGEGIDIILCLDVSGSMLAEDFTPSRLDAAKQMAADFVDRRPTDRIGVVIFAGESFTLCPLTTDKIVLKSQILNVQTGMLEDGTAIGDGLATSVERLRKSESKSRIIILLTDGENQGGLISPESAKEIAKSIGIKIYTIGVGTEGYAPVPTKTRDGVVNERQKVNINEDLLRAIAAETKGLYFRARDNESLRNIYNEIDKLEKSRIEVTALKRYTERFYPFALAAAVLLMLEILLRYTIFRKLP